MKNKSASQNQSGSKPPGPFIKQFFAFTHKMQMS